MPPSRILLCTWVLSAVLLPSVHASSGDRQPEYQSCVAACKETGCVAIPGTAESDRKCDTICNEHEPLELAIFRWQCEDDCQYRCMREIEDARMAMGLQPQKYHGKWPFLRTIGMQEVVSAMLSLMNYAVHVVAGMRYKDLTQPGEIRLYKPKDPYEWAWWCYIITALNAWFWSAIFHMRDFPETEGADYMCADVFVAFALLATCVRVLELKRPRECMALAVPILGGLAAHMHYMLVVKFDYGWNVKLCVACGVLSSCLWLWWAIRAKDHPGRARLVLYVVGLNAASLLELLDFPPLWGHVDAHALWHLTTIPLSMLWYSFLFADHRHLVREPGEQKKAE